MSMEFIVKVDKKVYEISQLVTKVSFNDVLNDGCSKLEFSYINDGLIIKNGSIVQFSYEGLEFRGFVFKVSRNNDKEISITAYDQLRYCKAKDTIVVFEDTITTLTTRMCNYFKLKKGTLTDTKYILATSVQDSNTWLDIIYTAISDTLMNKGKKYCLRDEFGSIAIRDLEDLQLNLLLGDESLCYAFDYEKSIDSDFYNQIKMYIKDEENSKQDMIIEHDATSISKFGVLQYFETVDGSTNSSQTREKAKALLRLYNKEVETLSLDCLGNTSVRAGCSFYGQISDIKLDKRLIVKSVTHQFLPVHTMSLEVIC